MKKFEINLRRRNIPNKELAADIRRVAESMGQTTLTAAAYDEKGRFGKTTILRRFGAWNTALEVAGLRIVLTSNNKEETLFGNLADVWQKLGRQPVGSDMEKTAGLSKFALGTYEKRFGSWNKALQAFGDFVNNSEMMEVAPNIGNSKINHGKWPRKINWRLRAMVLIRDNCICKMCGASPAKDPAVVLHVDHIKPWSKGGATMTENLRTLCSVCNIGKSNAL